MVSEQETELKLAVFLFIVEGLSIEKEVMLCWSPVELEMWQWNEAGAEHFSSLLAEEHLVYYHVRFITILFLMSVLTYFILGKSLRPIP
jgi:hypothetical protein